jgi:hypothetical protein
MQPLNIQNLEISNFQTEQILVFYLIFGFNTQTNLGKLKVGNTWRAYGMR